MTGYMFVLGSCFACGKQFTFNATWVPSVPASISGTGEKEPICASCIERANPMRIANGLDPIVPHPNAYAPEEVA